MNKVKLGIGILMLAAWFTGVTWYLLTLGWLA